MRKLILSMQMTWDGFVGGPSGEVEWAFPDFDADFEKWQVEKLSRADAHLMGRVVYGEMAGHWPSSTEPYAKPMNEIPKIVFSKTMTDAPWGETRVVSGDLKQEVIRLKQEDGKELLAHGGAAFARSLIAAGLVDEYRMLIHPVTLGSGRRIFPETGTPSRFKVGDVKTFKTGMIAVSYLPA